MYVCLYINPFASSSKFISLPFISWISAIVRGLLACLQPYSALIAGTQWNNGEFWQIIFVAHKIQYLYKIRSHLRGKNNCKHFVCSAVADWRCHKKSTTTKTTIEIALHNALKVFRFDLFASMCVCVCVLHSLCFCLIWCVSVFGSHWLIACVAAGLRAWLITFTD